MVTLRRYPNPRMVMHASINSLSKRLFPLRAEKADSENKPVYPEPRKLVSNIIYNPQYKQ
jgi:hypothetical protein